MSQQRIDHRDILLRFDDAVAKSSISWAPANPLHLTGNGFHFQLRLCPQFLYKPQLADAEFHEADAISDIADPPSLRITSIFTSHRLALNAYPVLRPSYLLLTNSPTHQQSSPLDLSDVRAAWAALDLLDDDSEGSEFMMIYNYGRDAGCSRSHKHMQMFPRPLDFVLFPDRPLNDIVKVPYIYDLIRLSPSSSTAEIASSIFSAYLSCLQHARAVLGVGESEHVPHNVVLVRGWMLVIPRKRARVGGMSTNAAGMMGLVWVATEEELKEWKERGAWNVLREMGIAIDN